MSPLIQEALRSIESESPAVVREGFLTLAEVVAVNRLQGFHSEIVPAANDEILEWAALEEIQRAILHWIEAHPHHECVSSAFWVLDKFRDKALRPFLRQWLDSYVQDVLPYLAPIGQILVNLDSLGEHTNPDGSFLVDGNGQTLDDAIRYLRSIKPKR